MAALDGRICAAAGTARRLRTVFFAHSRVDFYHESAVSCDFVRGSECNTLINVVERVLKFLILKVSR